MQFWFCDWDVMWTVRFLRHVNYFHGGDNIGINWDNIRDIYTAETVIAPSSPEVCQATVMRAKQFIGQTLTSLQNVLLAWGFLACVKKDLKPVNRCAARDHSTQNCSSWNSFESLRRETVRWINNDSAQKQHHTDLKPSRRTSRRSGWSVQVSLLVSLVV